MSRQTIADYLGLAIETVSRVVTQLESSGVIALDNSRHNFLMTRPLVERSDIVLRDNIDPKERLTNRHLY